MVSPGYLRALGVSVAIWLGLFVLFTWTIDPYGVSPLRLSLQGMNAQKPKRIDIDRLIKPYEVWRYQPRTVFLGTSRMHQSMDPAVLDGTRFAPAYNASMPAASMDMHAAYLRRYIQLDPNLRTVIVELFLPNFIGAPAGQEFGTRSEFIWNAVTLFGSADTLWDSASTLAYNVFSGRPIFQVSPGGYLDRPPGRDTQAPFEGFAAYVWGPGVSEPDRATFNQAAFDSVLEIIETARANDLELIFLVTPSHGYADYYYDAVGAWSVIEQWLARLSGRATVYSFSQANDWVNEPITPSMTYWNDTFHFPLTMGRGTGSTRAAGSQYSQPLMPRFTRTCRRNVSTPGAQIIARTRTPKKHSAPGCWSPRRVAPAAERCSNAVLECRVYRRFAVTSQSKLPWTRRRRSGAEHERQRARVLEITPEMIRPCKESSPSLLQSGRCRLHS
jgi:hypothetical protein